MTITTRVSQSRGMTHAKCTRNVCIGTFFIYPRRVNKQNVKCCERMKRWSERDRRNRRTGETQFDIHLRCIRWLFKRWDGPVLTCGTAPGRSALTVTYWHRLPLASHPAETPRTDRASCPHTPLPQPTTAVPAGWRWRHGATADHSCRLCSTHVSGRLQNVYVRSCCKPEDECMTWESLDVIFLQVN